MKLPDHKSVKLSVSLPSDVNKMAEIRTKEEGYHSKSSYLSGLVLFDYYCRRKHWLTTKVMDAPREVREQIIREILENPGRESTWIDHVIERRAKEWIDAGGALGESSTQRPEVSSDHE